MNFIKANESIYKKLYERVYINKYWLLVFNRKKLDSYHEKIIDNKISKFKTFLGISLKLLYRVVYDQSLKENVYSFTNISNLSVWDIDFKCDLNYDIHNELCNEYRETFIKKINRLEVLPFEITMFHLFYLVYFLELESYDQEIEEKYENNRINCEKHYQDCGI